MTKKEVLNLQKHIDLDPKGEFTLTEKEREFVRELISIWRKTMITKMITLNDKYNKNEITYEEYKVELDKILKEYEDKKDEGRMEGN